MLFSTSVIYNAGSYGTFIEWCLNFFSDPDFPQDLPFLSSGNSHKFEGNFLPHVNAIENLTSKSKFDLKKIYRFHPKTEKNESVKSCLQFASSNFQKIIFLHPCYDTIIWNINNKFEKVWPEGWLKRNEYYFQENLKKWNYNHLADMQQWQIREFLSFFIEPQHISESELDNLENFKKEFDQVMFVNIKDLRDNFEETIKKIFKFCGMQLINEDKINQIYTSWIMLQYHRNKDKLVNEIVHAVVNNLHIEWPELTLIDESFIQQGLRKSGLELKCYNLNKFPKSTLELTPLLYAS